MLAPLSRESVTSLKVWLNKALADCDPGNINFKARAVTCLKNGGILMELDSNEALVWFMLQDMWEQFLEKFHSSTSINTRSFQIIMQFMPLTFIMQFMPLTLEPGRDIELQEVKEVNGLDRGDILNARWIKPIERVSQICGHAIFSFESLQVTNEILLHGLFICHKKVYTDKCKKEPLSVLNAMGGVTWCRPSQLNMTSVALACRITAWLTAPTSRVSTVCQELVFQSD